MKMKVFRSAFAVGVILLLLVLGNNQNVFAVQSGGWLPDEKIPGYLDDTFTPFLLADQNKTVHAFTSQRASGLNYRKVIVYRQWTLLGGWTRPVDIILAPSGNADFLGAFLDQAGMLHVIFMAGGSTSPAVFYSKAPIANADWAPAWSAPVMMGSGAASVESAAITGDDLGNLVVIYSGYTDGEGVYFVTSSDSGANWSKPESIFLTHDNSLVAYSLRLFMGATQQVRAAWNVVTGLGSDDSLYFANYDMNEGKWSVPVELDKRDDAPDHFGPSFPSIVDNGRQIVVFYNGGNPVANRPVLIGRPVQRVLISNTGGTTWNEPMEPFRLLVGRSGEHAMTLDGNGIPHVLFVQRIETTDDKGKYMTIDGIWHSAFQDSVWTNPDRLVTSVAPHDVRAVVSQGNVLLVVWRMDPGAGSQGVWYSYSILDAPELPVVPLPTASSNVLVPQATSSVSLQTVVTPSPTNVLFDNSHPSVWASNPAFPILAGVIPVIVVLLGIFLGYRVYLNRKT